MRVGATCPHKVRKRMSTLRLCKKRIACHSVLRWSRGRFYQQCTSVFVSARVYFSVVISSPRSRLTNCVVAAPQCEDSTRIFCRSAPLQPWSSPYTIILTPFLLARSKAKNAMASTKTTAAFRRKRQRQALLDRMLKVIVCSYDHVAFRRGKTC